MTRTALSWKVATWCAAAVLLLAIAGFVYEWVGERRDRLQFPQVGRSIDIGGRSQHLLLGRGKPDGHLR